MSDCDCSAIPNRKHNWWLHFCHVKIFQPDTREQPTSHNYFCVAPCQIPTQKHVVSSVMRLCLLKTLYSDFLTTVNWILHVCLWKSFIICCCLNKIWLYIMALRILLQAWNLKPMLHVSLLWSFSVQDFVSQELSGESNIYSTFYNLPCVMQMQSAKTQKTNVFFCVGLNK